MSALIYVSTVRALRHVERTAAITDPALLELGTNEHDPLEATTHASDEQKGQPTEERSRRTAQAERRVLA